MYDYSFAPQGWQCPICKRVYSPMTPCCFSCGGERTTFATTGTDVNTTAEIFEMFNRMPEEKHEQDELH